eukprot:TRINITY_DN30560_c0_g1_i1.p1 TRINITY_DN30560_c0_g1~~TRINITY_DN30560_c0_g1_i1.p1  ORF type:complete len:1189 (+),score=206.05 TRINITY_DN30560_c0_g1_i1:32-3598(+)
MDSVLRPEDTSGYSALACRDRWLALQRLRVARNLDAIVLVLGPDAGFTLGNDAAYNWLLLGASGRELMATSLDSRHNECVLCLREHRNLIFCKRAVHEEITIRTALWEGVELVVPTKEEEADSDRYEAKKIRAFIEMVSDCRSLGVFARSHDMSTDLKMTVERWPLVQAFGYDEYGYGFLTLRSSVTNLEEDAHRNVYTQWDLHSILWAQRLAKSLHKTWEDAVIFQERRGMAANSTTAMAAPLVDYFEYGRLTMSDDEVFEIREGSQPGEPLLLDPAPRVLVGSAQSEEILHAVELSGLQPSAPRTAEDAHHMIWEAVDPLTGIAATRTYGLSTHFAGEGRDSSNIVRVATLLRAYAASAECCRRLLAGGAIATAAFSPNGEAELVQTVEGIMSSEYPDVLGKPRVTCEAMDAMGLPCKLQQQFRCNGVLLVFVRVTISGVSCPEFGLLGAVAYGDSAFCVCPRLEDGRAAASAALCASLPAIAIWSSSVEASRSKQVKDGLETSLGVGLDWGPSVALGHRSGVQVYLDPPPPPPDPLALGEEILDVAKPCQLAIAIAGACHMPLTCFTNGVCWTYGSGKAVVSSPRVGYLLLKICEELKRRRSLAEAADGLVWVEVEEVAENLRLPWLRMALAVSPTTAVTWQQQSASLESEEVEVQAPADKLDWLMAMVSASVSSAGISQQEFLAWAALALAHCGQMPAETCRAVFDECGISQESGGCRCVLVSGLPGCAVMDVASALASALDAPLLDLGQVLGAGPVAPELLNSPQCVEQLCSALQSNASGRAWLVLCDVWHAPATLLIALQGSLSCPPITHVVSAVEPFVAYPWGAVRHPLLLSRALRGWVSSALVQDLLLRDSSVVQSPTIVRHHRLLSDLLLKELQSSRAGHQTLHRPVTGDIIKGPLREPAAGAALRALALPSSVPGFSAEAVCATPLHSMATLRCCFLPVARPVDLETMKQRCMARLREAAEASSPSTEAVPKNVVPHWRGLFCIEARVVGTPSAVNFWNQGPAELRAAAARLQSSEARSLVFTPMGELGAPQHWMDPLASQMGMIWWWCVHAGDAAELSNQRLIAVTQELEACLLQPLPETSPWCLDDVPRETAAQVEQDVVQSGPPAGYFFDGTRYIHDVDGHICDRHPELEKRLQMVVEHHNSELLECAAVRREVAALPMFSSVTMGDGSRRGGYA